MLCHNYFTCKLASIMAWNPVIFDRSWEMTTDFGNAKNRCENRTIAFKISPQLGKSIISNILQVSLVIVLTFDTLVDGIVGFSWTEMNKSFWQKVQIFRIHRIEKFENEAIDVNYVIGTGAFHNLHKQSLKTPPKGWMLPVLSQLSGSHIRPRHWERGQSDYAALHWICT